jgi:hypothetical protein
MLAVDLCGGGMISGNGVANGDGWSHLRPGVEVFALLRSVFRGRRQDWWTICYQD